MPVEPRRLLVLRAVRRAGGVLPAARALHLTPSGVSQHLTRLEAETGLALVDRSRRGGGRSLELTAAGHALAEQGERLAEVLADVEREVAGLLHRTSGPVRVGGFATVLRRIAAPAITATAVSHPAVQPAVVEVDEREGLAALRAGRLDLLLVERRAEAPHPLRGVEVEDLLRDRYRVVVPAAWSPSLETEALLRGPWVGAEPGLPGREALERLYADHDPPLRPDVRHVGAESSTLLALVGAGLGAGVVSDLMLDYLPHPGVRVTVGPLDPGARLLSVVHRRGRSEPSPAAAALLDAMRTVAAEPQDA